mmetsp:Transcript_3646/g.10557  ORF Transcript_3646/g.10557 Transcript_3646/m.10557 type:complete len:425 (+) Transcript_3646:146-1420(+)
MGVGGTRPGAPCPMFRDTFRAWSSMPRLIGTGVPGFGEETTMVPGEAGHGLPAGLRSTYFVVGESRGVGMVLRDAVGDASTWEETEVVETEAAVGLDRTFIAIEWATMPPAAVGDASTEPGFAGITYLAGVTTIVFGDARGCHRALLPTGVVPTLVACTGMGEPDSAGMVWDSDSLGWTVTTVGDSSRFSGAGAGRRLLGELADSSDCSPSPPAAPSSAALTGLGTKTLALALSSTGGAKGLAPALNLKLGSSVAATTGADVDRPENPAEIIPAGIVTPPGMLVDRYVTFLAPAARGAAGATWGAMETWPLGPTTIGAGLTPLTAGASCACTSAWSSWMPWAKVQASAFLHQPWAEKWLQRRWGAKCPGKRRAGWVGAKLCAGTGWTPPPKKLPGGAALTTVAEEPRAARVVVVVYFDTPGPCE